MVAGFCLEKFDFEYLALLDDVGVFTAVGDGVGPDDLSEFELFHVPVSFSIILKPATGLQVNQQSVRVGMQWLVLAVSDSLFQNTYAFVLKLERKDVRRNTHWIEWLGDGGSDDCSEQQEWYESQQF